MRTLFGIGVVEMALAWGAASLCAQVWVDPPTGLSTVNADVDSQPPTEYFTNLPFSWSMGAVTLATGQELPPEEFDLRYTATPPPGGIPTPEWYDAMTLVEGEPTPSGLDYNLVLGVELTGLTPDTTYYFRIRAGYQGIWSSWRSDTGRTRPDLFDPSAPMNLAVSAVGARSVTLNWIAPGNDGPDDIRPAGSLEIRQALLDPAGFPDPAAWWNDPSTTAVEDEPAPGIPGQVQQMIVRGLQADRPYWFMIEAHDEAGHASPLSNAATGIPTAPGPGSSADSQTCGGSCGPARSLPAGIAVLILIAFILHPRK